MSIYSKLKSYLQWKINNHLPDYDVDLLNLCQNVNFGESICMSSFKESGIVVVKGVFTQEEQDYFIKLIDNNLIRSEFSDSYKGQPYHLSSISKIKDFSRFLTNKKLLSVVSSLIEGDARFVGHDSITRNYSVPGLHDDQNTHKQFFKNEPYPENFSTVRVLTYLSRKNSAPHRFGFVSGSHIRDGFDIDYNYSKRNTTYVEVSHGTVIFFDPRLVHTSSTSNHEKNMVVATFDRDDEYSERVFKFTSVERGQGSSESDADFWNELEKHELKPSYINC